MNMKPVYITINDRPLCECESHVTGLINKLGITCSYKSFEDAKNAKEKIEKFGKNAVINSGHCPLY
tara:strand:+ start:820 stop:1017 length:198 start_codon:yes stop_codon:yes gene_type:complete